MVTNHGPRAQARPQASSSPAGPDADTARRAITATHRRHSGRCAPREPGRDRSVPARSRAGPSGHSRPLS